MARIVGVDIPNDKPVKIALTYIYGIGRYTAVQICEGAKVDGMIRVKDLTDDQFAAIRNEIAKYKTEGDLRREVALNIDGKLEKKLTVQAKAFSKSAEKAISDAGGKIEVI